jgi:hypothetical protein
LGGWKKFSDHPKQGATHCFDSIFPKTRPGIPYVLARKTYDISSG